jgi:hypothetical protein
VSGSDGAKNQPRKLSFLAGKLIRAPNCEDSSRKLEEFHTLLSKSTLYNIGHHHASISVLASKFQNLSFAALMPNQKQSQIRASFLLGIS